MARNRTHTLNSYMKKEIPDISVIVPIYKVEAYIKHCAESLFEQTKKEGVEYIFVNDCTPDRSMQIVEEVALGYPDRLDQIRYVHHASNKGVSAARNSGLDVAQGEYIVYIDGDDWIEKEMLADMYKAAKENDADIVRCDFFCTYSTFEKRMKSVDEVDPVECIKLLLSEKIHGGLWSKLIRHTLYTDNKIVFFDGYWEDLRASVQFFYYAKKTVYVPKSYYHYTQYNDNAQGALNLDKKLDEIIRNTDGIIDFLEDKHLPLDKYIHYLKLAAKQTLLFTCDKSSYRKWLQIYPESNKYTWSYPSLPLHLRIIGGCTTLRLWPLIDLWIWMKKWRGRK